MSDDGGLCETLTDDLADIARLAEKIGGVLEDNGVPTAEIARINLAIEELVTNVVRHGFGGGGKGNTVRVAVEVTEGIIVTTIEDQGPEFDPFARERADTSLPLEDREIGGLGIFLARECMDEVAYQRLGRCNRVTLRRTIRRLGDQTIAGTA